MLFYFFSEIWKKSKLILRNRDLRRKKREGRRKEKKGELMPGDQKG